MLEYDLDESDPSEIETIGKEYDGRPLDPMFEWTKEFR
jgi:hypothetical protein